MIQVLNGGMGDRFVPLVPSHIHLCGIPLNSIPNTLKIKVPINAKMMNAGIVATAHLTMRTTIDPKGILMS